MGETHFLLGQTGGGGPGWHPREDRGLWAVPPKPGRFWLKERAWLRRTDRPSPSKARPRTALPVPDLSPAPRGWAERPGEP